MADARSEFIEAKIKEMRKKPASIDVKLLVVANFFENDMSINDLASTFFRDPSQIRRWIKDFEIEGDIVKTIKKRGASKFSGEHSTWLVDFYHHNPDRYLHEVSLYTY